MNVSESPLLMVQERVQFRFPRSKKRRIRKKWSKQPWNYRMVPRDYCYQIGNQLLVSPGLMAKIAREIGYREEMDLFAKAAFRVGIFAPISSPAPVPRETEGRKE